MYDAALSAANIQVLASKINGDSSLGAGTTNLKGWWKLTNGDLTDSSTNSNALTASGSPAQDYDAFSVDVYDNSTTTDGTFTVTQGKLEGLSLSSLLLDGTGDYVALASSIELTTYDWSISCWFRADEFSSNTLLGHSNGEHLIQFVNSTTLRTNINNRGNEDITVSGLSTDKWHHLTYTRDDSTGVSNIYIDGVYNATGTFDSGYDFVINRIGIDGNDEFDGDIRDVRIYDNLLLSADQVASLYSGSYNVTPTHWYKMDEGTGATANDTGTATTRNGTLNGNASLGGSNGTLDLDSTLTIATNGTLSAPRGNLNIDDDIDINGTFTNNSGTVVLDPATTNRSLYANNASFYNLTINDASSKRWIIRENVTVENTFANNANSLKTEIKNIEITIGTSSSAGSLTGKELFTDNTGTTVIQGVSSLYPAVITATSTDNGTGPFGSSVATAWQLKNLDVQTAVITAGDTATYTLTGDCEFDAVTVSNGDTFNVNGQRAEFSGTFTTTGTVTGTGYWYFTGSGTLAIGGGASWTHDATAIVQQGTSTDTISLRDSNAVGTVFYNQPSVQMNTTSHRMGRQHIVGAGTWGFTSTATGTTTDLTVATGGTLLEADASTISVAGDFTTSGGLLGASAITLDGGSPASKYVSCNATVVNGATTYTMEAWIKPDVNNVRQHIIDARDSGSDGTALSLVNQTIRFRINSDDLITDNVITATGKWYHIAATRDSSNVTKIYVDGKLVKQGSSTASISISQDLRIGALAYAPPNEGFDGSIDEVRIWNDERSPTEIRANMFSEISSVGSDLILYAKFNEGTGNPVDSGTNTRTLTATGDIWAGAGTFIFGTSDLVMTGSSKKINYLADDEYGKLSITGTVSLNGVDSTSAALLLRGNLNFTGSASGTLASTSSEHIILDQTWVNNGAVVAVHGSGNHIANLSKLRTTHTSGTKNLPA